MLGLGILPDSPKITKVVPLYKKDLDNDNDNDNENSLF